LQRLAEWARCWYGGHLKQLKQSRNEGPRGRVWVLID
jgi:hypothetical protein